MAHTKKVTYEDYGKFSGNSELIHNQTLDLFGLMNWTEDAFLFFDITKENTFQLSFFKEDLFLVEITNDDENMVFHQRYANYHQAVELISTYFNANSIIDTTGFYLVPINLKTLDEVLRELKQD